MERPPLLIEVVEDRRGLVGRLIGDLDTGASAVLQDYVASVLATSGGDVVLDLADVAFIDSNGVRALLQARRCAGECGRSVRLEDLSRPVRRVVDLLGIHQVLDAPPPAAGRAPLSSVAGRLPASATPVVGGSPRSS